MCVYVADGLRDINKRDGAGARIVLRRWWRMCGDEQGSQNLHAEIVAASAWGERCVGCKGIDGEGARVVRAFLDDTSGSR